MIGRRIESPFTAGGGLIGEWPEPGDFYFYPEAGWCGVSPNGHMVCLRNHNVTEHEDGTISVVPSILVSGRSASDNGIRVSDEGNRELWHGYLERGVWRTV
jgi:hypothetical protein